MPTYAKQRHAQEKYLVVTKEKVSFNISHVY